jgi:hypothetical protein
MVQQDESIEEENQTDNDEYLNVNAIENSGTNDWFQKVEINDVRRLRLQEIASFNF